MQEVTIGEYPELEYVGMTHDEAAVLVKLRGIHDRILFSTDEDGVIVWAMMIDTI
jgi:hypothetical protein